MPASRFCTNCGHRLNHGELLCPNCGAVASDVGSTTASLRLSGSDDVDVEVPEARGAALFVRRGPNAGALYRLDGERVTIGRDPNGDIFLNHQTVSRHHLELHRSGVRTEFVDVGSYNGTYVNGERRDSGVLAHGDELQVGLFKLVFIDS